MALFMHGQVCYKCNDLPKFSEAEELPDNSLVDPGSTKSFYKFYQDVGEGRKGRKKGQRKRGRGGRERGREGRR